MVSTSNLSEGSETVAEKRSGIAPGPEGVEKMGQGLILPKSP